MIFSEIDKKEKRSFLYLCAITFYLIYKFGFLVSSWNMYIGLLSLFLFVSSMYFADYYAREKVFFLFNLLGMTIIYLFSKEMNLIFLSIIIFSGKGINKNKILKVFLICYLMYFFIMFIQNLFGIYENDYAYKLINGENVKVRTYGFGHPNQIANRFISFTGLVLYLGKEKIQNIHLFFLIIVFLFIYTISLTRTALVIFFILMIIHQLMYRYNMSKIIAKFSVYIFYLSITFSVFAPLLYINGGGFLKLLDSLLSGRLRLTMKFFNSNAIKLFGQQLDYSGYDNVLDATIPYILLTYGIVFFIYYLILSQKLFNINNYNSDYSKTIYYVLFVLIGVVELVTINLSFNFTLLFLIDIIENNVVNSQNIEIMTKNNNYKFRL